MCVCLGGREWGKSVSIKMVEAFKQAYWRLAELMVREGRLPDADLLMFLTHLEIGRLISSRSGALVAKYVQQQYDYITRNCGRLSEFSVRSYFNRIWLYGKTMCCGRIPTGFRLAECGAYSVQCFSRAQRRRKLLDKQMALKFPRITFGHPVPLTPDDAMTRNARSIASLKGKRHVTCGRQAASLDAIGCHL